MARTGGTVSALVSRLRRIGAHPRLQPAVALVLRGRTTRTPARFVARELLGRRVAARYRLRESAMRVIVRHRTGDVVTLGEVFHRPDYAPPSPVAAVLGRAPRVLDLGANIGLFGAFVLGRWPSATVTAFEPDPDNADILRRTVALNGLAERWHVEQAAAAAHDGELPFAAGGIALSRIDAGADARVPARDVLGLLADVDWLKLDIEGGEWAILGDPRLARCAPPVVVLEYHPHLCPAPDPRAAVLDSLRAAGYTDIHELFTRTDGHGMLWAWRA